MNKKQLEATKYIGYSKGKAYPLYAVKPDNVGLCDIEGCAWPKWCTFERIGSINENNNLQKPIVMLKIGDKIELKSGMQYEIVEAYEDGFYDIKALQPHFKWMPDFFPIYYSIALRDYKVLSTK
jgi:hypothetical protein